MATRRKPRRSFWDDLRGVGKLAGRVAEVTGSPIAASVAEVVDVIDESAGPVEGPDPNAPICLREKYPDAIDVPGLHLGYYPTH